MPPSGSLSGSHQNGPLHSKWIKTQKHTLTRIKISVKTLEFPQHKYLNPERGVPANAMQTVSGGCTVFSRRLSLTSSEF